MGLIESVLLSVLGLLAAIVVSVATKLIAADAEEWLPWIRDRLIQRAVRRLPESERERYSEEWQSHVNETPGDLSKIVVAFGLRFAANSIANTLYSEHPLTVSQSIQEVTRRGIDIIVSTLLLVLLSPLTMILVVLIKLDSPGPALYLFKRLGRNGRSISIMKMRTIRIDLDRNEIAHRDPVTRVGRFLRRTGLDNLPQLFNVLLGDMTLVGPRPWLPDFAKLGDARTTVKPGLTGLSQIDGRLRFIETVEDYNDYYIKHRSLWLDLRILAASVINLFAGRPKF
jgi:lipopolysaccharide/colanic/teichoic acid biosynthesis glycosyltransferase